MIKSIRMKSCASYDASGVLIDDCNKVNFFYGANGSGKSTIASYLQNQSDKKFSACNIQWATNSAVDILVYNKEFREKNFKEYVKGIFTIGNDTILALQEIELLEAKQTALKNEHDNLYEKINNLSELNKITTDFKDDVWKNIFKKYPKFKDAFVGFQTKDKFLDKIRETYIKHQYSDKSEEYLCQKAETLFSNSLEKYELLIFKSLENLKELHTIEKDNIWSKIIIGNQDLQISKLIKSLDNSDWVNQGRKYIQSNDTCPFCQHSTITESLKEQLNDFFSGEFKKDLEHVTVLSESYKVLHTNLIDSLLQAEKKSKFLESNPLNLEKLQSLKQIIDSILSNNLKIMETKKIEVSRILTLKSTEKHIQDFIEFLNNVNALISKHNEWVDNHSIEKKNLISDIWDFVVSENLSLIKVHANRIDTIQKTKNGEKTSLEKCKVDLKKIESSLTEKTAKSTGIKATIDKINHCLIAFGFTNFKIIASKERNNYYQICRNDGTLVADTLSEGELTFITFLYFMQLAEGSTDLENVSKKRILVLDDPISSLDSTILYLVSSIVKNLISKVKDNLSNVSQIFIFTHNVFFHKEVSFIDQRTTQLKTVFFWTISKDRDISSIKPYRKVNPIKSTYELLWQELKSENGASKITLQNTMRKILENYFTLLGSKKYNFIVDAFNEPEDKIICKSLVSWVNDGSHSIYDDLHIDSYIDSADKYKEIFKKIFEEMGHAAHYTMMMNS